ncbi:MBL fold metallo-hydrolase [Paludicola sp. MB14-C6]|uniref:MBL fold metallo-hydrolase n=1 Tax=Paludihabitans sp. MB14-C6 TaxID=3070656 RepID=UPI0027DD4491|nr:MBL fold metallo-hydrolase [Paludicola sp. MB14-C6]WMJ24015.1 MBL fold metallo-hydrolase [Paludicola sp. MB14-C6]
MSYVYSLCSSSKGNCTYIGNKNSGVLVDVGIGIRDFTRFLEIQSIALSSVKAIFITHEHTDHIKGLTTVLKKINVPIYASRGTLEQLVYKNAVNGTADLNEINKRSVCIDDIEIAAFQTPHDAAHSLGYRIETNQGKKICVCTDLGHMTDEIYVNLKASDFILLESNYDEDMLHNGDYPYFLKNRISGNDGHLSNENCSKTLVSLLQDGTSKFLLGHLSENNNRPHLAYDTAINELQSIGAQVNKDFQLSVAAVKCNGDIFEV